jgi:hypothetical protein
VIVRLTFQVAYTLQITYVQNHGMNDTTNQDAGWTCGQVTDGRSHLFGRLLKKTLTVTGGRLTGCTVHPLQVIQMRL